MARCPTCGATYGDGARFCTRDGTRLVHAAPAQGQPAAVSAGAAVPPRPPRSRPLIGATLQGRYRIDRRIGEGGMSVVYLALDAVSGQPRAIKILSSALSNDENSMARLRREASMGMRLSHPNVCHIVDVGETEDGRVFVVMPFVQGEVLADRQARRGTIPLAEAVSLARDVAAGLQAAHDLGIVHRDLKPENVMISPAADGRDHAVVMDFGLAKERRASGELRKLTKTGTVVGTPEFMSPEQLRGRPLDGRTDTYALALLVCEMLTGKLPFEGRTQQQIMLARLRSEPLSLRAMRPDLELPDGVERVLHKALHREPEQRHQRVIDFAAELAAAASARGASTMFARDRGRAGT